MVSMNYSRVGLTQTAMSGTPGTILCGGSSYPFNE